MKLTGLIIILLCLAWPVSAQRGNVAQMLRESAGLIQSGNFSDAEQILIRATALAPENADAHNLLGIVRDQLGKPAEAEREYRSAIRLSPRAVSPRANLGILLARLNRPAEAAAAFQAALKIDPKHPQSIVNLGILYASTGDAAKALAYLQKAAVIQPDDYEIRFRLAETLYQLRRPDAAKAEFETASRIRPDAAEPYYNLGVIAFDAKDFQTAASLLEEALNRKSDYADVYFMAGEILAAQKRYAEAVKFYEKAVGFDKTKSVYFVRLGGAYLLNYEPLKSFQYFKEAVDRWPDIPEIRYFYAISARSTGDYELAFKEARRTLEMKESADACALLGSLYIDRNELVEADKFLRRAIALNGAHFNAQFDLGRILVKQQKFVDALPLLRRAADLNPDVADVHYQLFIVYSRLKRKSDADRELETFKKLSNQK